jgi:drug/metabolite transporter (DMT)-like permease
MKRKNWLLLLFAVVLMFLYFILFLYLGTHTDIKYGAFDRLHVDTEILNTIYKYINAFSVFILIQFMIIFYLLYKVNRK